MKLKPTRKTQTMAETVASGSKQVSHASLASESLFYGWSRLT